MSAVSLEVVFGLGVLRRLRRLRLNLILMDYAISIME
jgi:hypothetical protein